jgi:O-antigen/teichoic acid export membrane protein
MLRSILSNWVGVVVMGVISFILTPILIHGLGDFYYGMWILVAQAVDYYGLLDMGMRWSLFRFVARLKGANAREGLNQTFTTALVITVGIGLSLILLTLVLVIVLPRFFGVTGPARSVFQWLVLLLGLSVAAAFPAQVLGAYLRGLQRFDLFNVAGMVVSASRAILLVTAIRMGYGVVAAAAATLAVSILSLFLHWWLVRRADPGVAFVWKSMTWAHTRELVSYSFYGFLSTTGEYLRFYTDSVVIGRVLGIALITPFSVAGRLMDYFRTILTTINGPMMAEMSELDGQARHEDLKQFFLRGTRVTALFSVFIGSILVLDGRALIRIWVGENLVSSYRLLWILTIGYVVAFAQHPSLMVIFARAKLHRALGGWTLVEGIANLLLSIYWAHQYGLVGVALGTTVPLVLVKTFVQPRYALRVLELPARTYLTRGLARPVSVCAIFVTICWFVQRAGGSMNWFDLALRLSWQLVLFAILTYPLGLEASDRVAVRGLSRKLFASLRLVPADKPSV